MIPHLNGSVRQTYVQSTTTFRRLKQAKSDLSSALAMRRLRGPVIYEASSTKYGCRGNLGFIRVAEV